MYESRPTNDQDHDIDVHVAKMEKIIKKQIQNSSIKKENFVITDSEAADYKTQLTTLNTALDNINLDTTKYITDLKTGKTNDSKKNIINLLKMDYGLKYIDYVNKNNAQAYKEYLKYKSPETNSFYESIART